jgi:hypothetical protein
MALTASLTISQTLLQLSQQTQAVLAVTNGGPVPVVITTIQPTINPTATAFEGVAVPVPSIINNGQTLIFTWNLGLSAPGNYAVSAVVGWTDGVTQSFVSPTAVLVTGYSPAQPVPTYVGNFIGTFNGTGYAGDASSASAVASGSTTSRTLASRFSDTFNLKDYGATGDGIADDTVAIQSWLDATAAYPGGGTGYAPTGTYLFSSMLVWTRPYGAVLSGAGELKSILQWAGGSGGTAFRIYNGSQSLLRNLAIYGAGGTHKPSILVEVRGDTSDPGISGRQAPGEMAFENMQIGGGYFPNCDYGVSYTVAASDANNDQSFFKHVTITNAAISEFRETHQNGHSHRFYGCSFYGAGQYGLKMDRGSFEWRGGTMSGHTGADVYIGGAGTGGPPTTSVLDGINSENSSRLVLGDLSGVSAGGAPLVIRNARFSDLGLNADGWAVYIRMAGPLVIESSQIGDSGPGGSTIPRIRYDSGGYKGSVAIRSNQFGVKNSASVSPLQLDSSAWVQMSGNGFLDPASGIVSGSVLWDSPPFVLGSFPGNVLADPFNPWGSAPWVTMGPTVFTIISSAGLDGASSIVQMVPNAGTNPAGSYQAYTYGAGAYTLSAYVHAGTWNYVVLDFANLTTSGATFNLSTVSVGHTDAGITASIVTVGGGWYYIQIHGTPGAGASFPELYMSANGTTNGRTATWVGTESMYVWAVTLSSP